MMITHEREKLLHVLIYFSENVVKPGKIKLFKLLNFLDFLHFEKTGRSITGLQYYAWEQGPVPRDLYYEWPHPKRDFNEHLSKGKVPAGNYERQFLIRRVAFDEDLFSIFELKLMKKLAKAHMNDNAGDMIEKTHFDTRPWHEVYEVQNRPSAEIPYDLVLLRRNSPEDREVLERAEEYNALKAHYQ